MKIAKLLLFAVASAFLFGACQPKTFYEKIDAIDGESWHVDSILTYEILIEDSLQYYDMYVNLRNSTDFETQNFYLFLTTEFPDGTSAQDTLGCILCDAHGKWTGKGMGRLKDNHFLLKQKVRFPRCGTYRFFAQHGMRCESVNGIANFGISLNYYKQ